MKFFPHQTGRQQSVTFDTVKDDISQNIQKNCELGQEVATMLRNLEKTDCEGKEKKPTRTISQKSDPTEKQEEQESNDMIHKAEMDNWMKEKCTHKKELAKSRALIMSHCSSVMKSRIEVSPNCKSNIRDDPIEL